MTIRAALVLAAAVASGCASSGYHRSQDTADSMRAAAEAAEAFGAARQGAFVALNALTAEPLEGLPAKFEAFSAAVDAVAASERSFRAAVVDSRFAAAARFQAWEKEDASFENPAILARAQQRRAEARGFVERSCEETDAMLEQADGFVSYLSDLRRLLSNDLTPAGVAGIADLARNARSGNGQLERMARPTVLSLTAAADALSTRR